MLDLAAPQEADLVVQLHLHHHSKAPLSCEQHERLIL